MNPQYISRRSRTYAQWATGFVYVAGFVNLASVFKIGWSQNPWSRVRDIGSYLDTKPVVMAAIEIARSSSLWGTGSASLERMAHDHFARFRVDRRTLEPAGRGEWYLLPSLRAEDIELRIRDLAPGDEGFATASQIQKIAIGASAGPTSSSTSNMERL